MNGLRLALIVAVLCFIVPGRAAPQTGAAAAAPAPRALLDQYCVTCHNQAAKTGGLALDELDLARVSDNNDVWETVVRRIRTGAMPPAGMPRPDKALADGVVSWLETELDQAAP